MLASLLPASVEPWFAEGRISENDYEGIWCGVTFYIGDDKSLIRRHREDDPDEWGEDNLFGAAVAGNGGCVPNAELLDKKFHNSCTGKDLR